MTQATKRQRKRARAKRHQKGATARNRQRGYTSSDLVRMFGALRTADGEKIAFSDKQLSMVHETMSTRDRSSFHTQATMQSRIGSHSCECRISHAKSRDRESQ